MRVTLQRGDCQDLVDRLKKPKHGHSAGAACDRWTRVPALNVVILGCRSLSHSTKGELKPKGLLVLTLWSTKVLKVSLGSQSDIEELEIGGSV